MSPSTKIPISSETYPYPETNNSSTTSSNDQQARKGSVESLASLQSYESQVSVESSESQHSHDNSSSKPIPSTRIRRGGGASSSSGVEYQGNVQTTTTTTSRLSSTSRRTDSSSTGFSDGETDAETPSTVHSAPPCFNASMASFSSPRDIKYHQTSVNLIHSPNSDIWRKRQDFNASEYPLQVPQKPSITRSPNVSGQHRNLSESLLEQERMSRLERLTNKAVMNATMAKIDSPTKREQRRASDVESPSTVIITNRRDQIYGKDPKDYVYLRRQNSEGDATLSENISSVIAVSKEGFGPQKDKAEPDVPVRIYNLH